MHDIQSFAIVVDKMLNARTTYLRTSSDSAREEYTRLETQVRRMCREILSNRQTELFHHGD